jgi:polar amino acid transport system substrate-binding protein
MTMRWRHFAATAAVVAACGATQLACDRKPTRDVLAEVKARGAVRIGVKADSPPFGWKEESGYRGFDIDIATAIVEELGLGKIEFSTVTSANRLDKVAADEIDFAIASMTITRGREQKVDFTLPYFQDGQGLMVRADSTVESYEDLAGKSVGAVKGSTSITNITQVQPDCTVKEYGGMNQALEGLRGGEVDAITTDMLILLGLKLRAEGGDAFRLTGRRFSTEPYGIAVAEGQSKWRDALNEAIQRLWETGRWQRIYEEWFGEGATYSTDVPFVIVPYPK